MSFRFKYPLLVVILCLSTEVFGFSPSILLQVKGVLPANLYEDSGLDYAEGNSFWTHNDGYGDNHLYRINDVGNVLDTLTIINAVNYDWEDLTHDSARQYMFIGDFGNNLCQRTNLRVYRIPYPSDTTLSFAAAVPIFFSYPDQQLFPSPWMNFDAEGFFHYQNQLFIFTKGDSIATGYTKLYSIPDSPGSYNATFIDSFYINDRITGADISPDGSTVILLSNTKLHLFQNFTSTNFFTGMYTRLSISGSRTKKEGITFVDDKSIYLTDENEGFGNHLFKGDLSFWTSMNERAYEQIQLYPDPANAFINIRTDRIPVKNIELYNSNGRCLRKIETAKDLMIPTDQLSNGTYFLRLVLEDGNFISKRFLVVNR